MNRTLQRVDYSLHYAVGALVLRRWPWPLWRARGYGELPIGPELLRFEEVALPRYAWWAQETVRRRWEPEIIAQLMASLRPGDVFFDVGAFIGAFTLLASRRVGPEGRVVAFEPDAGARRLLQRNVAANGAGNVSVEPFAIGDRSGTVRFAASGNSVSRVTNAGEVEVQMVSLDDYCARSGLHPDVMKMDIEGGEGPALRDSRTARQLREFVVEIHEPALREQSVDPAELLASLGPHRVLEAVDDGNYGVLVTPGAAASR